MYEQLSFCTHHAGFIWVSLRILGGYPVIDFSRREPNPNHDSLVPYLLRGVTDEGGICLDFIREAIKRFDEDETYASIFDDAMVKISTKLSAMSMEDDYKPCVQVRCSLHACLTID